MVREVATFVLVSMILIGIGMSAYQTNEWLLERKRIKQEKAFEKQLRREEARRQSSV